MNFKFVFVLFVVFILVLPDAEGGRRRRSLVGRRYLAGRSKKVLPVAVESFDDYGVSNGDVTKDKFVSDVETPVKF